MLTHVCLYNKKNTTLGDQYEFYFLVLKTIFYHLKKKFIHSRRHVMSFIYVKKKILVLQVWVIKKNTGKKLEDIPSPFTDVKNIFDEVKFEDELTQSRCRGWLVAPSRRYLQADILFPGCKFDCRLTIRGRTGMTIHSY